MMPPTAPTTAIPLAAMKSQSFTAVPMRDTTTSSASKYSPPTYHIISRRVEKSLLTQHWACRYLMVLNPTGLTEPTFYTLAVTRPSATSIARLESGCRYSLSDDTSVIPRWIGLAGHGLSASASFVQMETCNAWETAHNADQQKCVDSL
jgi:hypothetical protein